MTVTYTTVAIVQKHIHNLSADIDADDITVAINQAENAVDSAMKKSGINGADFTFDATKHGVIRLATNAVAAFILMGSDVSTYSSASFASVQANILYAQMKFFLNFLSDNRIVDYLISL